MPMLADLVHKVISNIKPVDDRTYEMDASVKASIVAEVADICKQFPIPCYPQLNESGDNGYEKPMRAVAS